ncbi:DUF3039 domain-containing protein [Kytococcus sedentarius]|uniref:DUF3039 domain-containing protein n=1 Tax=Kytococcus sedentarius TaxID=1276 RepID=UPI0035BBB757
MRSMNRLTTNPSAAGTAAAPHRGVVMSQPMDPSIPDDPGGLSDPGTSTGLLERTERETQPIEPGDHERFSHYVRKEKILESAMTGEPVTALCGKIWVPGRNPDRFPVCPVCKEIHEGLRDPQDGGDSGQGDGN